MRTSFGTAAKADLKTTLVHKLFPTVGPKTVARAVMSAVRRRRRSVIIGPIAGIVMGTVISDDGLILTASADKSIKVWEHESRAKKWQCRQTLREHDGAVMFLMAKANSDRIYSTSADRTIKAWQSVGKEYKLCFTLEGHTKVAESARAHSSYSS